jgi:hypothetical protein
MPQEYSDRRRRDATGVQRQEEEGCHRSTVTGGGVMPQEYSDRRRRDATGVQ